MTDDRKPLRSPALRAMDVLRGDEDGDFSDLLTYLFDTINRGTIDFSVAAHLWMALDPDGDSTMQLVLKRRKAGKPIDKLARARVGHSAARYAEKLIGEGVKTVPAVVESSEKSGLSESEIYSWMAHRKRCREPGRLVRDAMKARSGQLPE